MGTLQMLEWLGGVFFALNGKLTPDLKTSLYFPFGLIGIFIWDHQFLLTIKHIIIAIKCFYDTFI